jgi:outer membrane receptor protein involved in Fe transport
VRAAVRDTTVVEEMVVTAQKRAENIQNVPLSIMAVSKRRSRRGASRTRAT